MRITPYTRMVFYHETDRMDIVNHSNYIHMMEEARVDFMDKIGVGYERMEQQGIMLPVLGITALPIRKSSPCGLWTSSRKCMPFSRRQWMSNMNPEIS